jgi:general stress protein YciG
MQDEPTKPKIRKGLAALSPERRRAIASMGGKSVPKEKRTFARNRAAASEAGKKGGRLSRPETRTFSVYPDLASAAGRIGGATAVSQKKVAAQNSFFLNLHIGDKHIIIVDEGAAFNLERARKKLTDAISAQGIALEAGWWLEVKSQQGNVILKMRDRAVEELV